MTTILKCNQCSDTIETSEEKAKDWKVIESRIKNTEWVNKKPKPTYHLCYSCFKKIIGG